MEIPSNKLAMSKALGAAFLKYQVEQLEKSVSPSPAPKSSRRPSSQADIIVVDASLLIHGLHHVERWSKPDRQETVVIPLEVLSTLDLLKRTSKPARTASRLLEDQVGYNPRFRIQLDQDHHATTIPNSPSPELQWIKNTLHCARSEIDSAPLRKVVLAVCPSPATADDRASGTLLLDSARLADIPILVLPTSGTLKPHPKRYGRVSPNASSSCDELDADVFDFEDLMRAKRRTGSDPSPTHSRIDSSPKRRDVDSEDRQRDPVVEKRGAVQLEVKEDWPALPRARQQLGRVMHEKDEWRTPKAKWRTGNVVAVC